MRVEELAQTLAFTTAHLQDPGSEEETSLVDRLADLDNEINLLADLFQNLRHFEPRLVATHFKQGCDRIRPPKTGDRRSRIIEDGCSSSFGIVAAYPARTARRPSMTYCTASAASSTPSKRDSSTLPVVPRERSTLEANRKTMMHIAATAAITAIRIAR
jgi:hypothetical protein